MSEHRGISSIEFIDAICKALNIEPDYITDIVIRLSPGQIAIIEIERVVVASDLFVGILEG